MGEEYWLWCFVYLFSTKVMDGTTFILRERGVEEREREPFVGPRTCKAHHDTHVCVRAHDMRVAKKMEWLCIK